MHKLGQWFDHEPQWLQTEHQQLGSIGQCTCHPRKRKEQSGETRRERSEKRGEESKEKSANRLEPDVVVSIRAWLVWMKPSHRGGRLRVVRVSLTIKKESKDKPVVQALKETSIMRDYLQSLRKSHEIGKRAECGDDIGIHLWERGRELGWELTWGCLNNHTPQSWQVSSLDEVSCQKHGRNASWKKHPGRMKRREKKWFSQEGKKT